MVVYMVGMLGSLTPCSLPAEVTVVTFNGLAASLSFPWKLSYSAYLSFTGRWWHHSLQYSNFQMMV